MIELKNGVFTLDNKLFRSCVLVDKSGVRTTSIVNLETGSEYVRRKNVAEFKFSVNGKDISSYYDSECLVFENSGIESEVLFSYCGYELLYGQNGSETLKLKLFMPEERLAVNVFYKMLPDLAGCLKWLSFECLEGEAHISNLFISMLNICPGKFADVDFFTNQGLDRKQAAFASCGDEDIIQLHNSRIDEGIFIGNSLPGPLRFFMVYPNWSSGIACGYSMSYASFNKYLMPGDKFLTGSIFFTLYKGKRDSPHARNSFREMIRHNLPEFADKDEVMYCTWLPFFKDINESLLLELIDCAAELGFKYFVVDDGWFVEGGWKEDKEKFPNGLDYVSRQVHKLGMKFGLWFNVGTDYGNTGSHPEDNILNACGRSEASGIVKPSARRCMASKHRDFLFRKLSGLLVSCDVDYFKLDFSSIISPYGLIPPGCESTEHQYHRDISDSVLEQYESIMHLREKLKTKHPELCIDFSFEAFGTGKPSIGALIYSDIHHASNLNTMNPDICDSKKIRDTFYQFCTTLPNERVMGSLICLEGEHDIENLLTAFIGAPLVTGDLRNIANVNRKHIASICANLKILSGKDGFPCFCKLRGDQPLGAIDWDGYARYSKKGNGFIAVFAAGTIYEDIEIRIPDYPENISIRCRNILTGEILGDYNSLDFIHGNRINWLKDNRFVVIGLETSGVI